MLFSFSAVALVLLQASVSAIAFSHSLNDRRSHRTLRASDKQSDSLQKRASGKITWYEAGNGACGGHNSGSDFIVALNTEEWDGGSHCYEMVTITFEGKTRQGQIVDRCMGCIAGELDLSYGLFSEFGSPEIMGTFVGQWHFGSGGSDNDGGQAQPGETTTTTPPPESTSTTFEPSTSTSIQSSTSTSIFSSVTPTTESSTPSTSATPTTTSISSTSSQATPTIDYTEVVNQLNLAYVQLGALMFLGLRASA